jgi:hypothetical protein
MNFRAVNSDVVELVHAGRTTGEGLKKMTKLTVALPNRVCERA